MKFTAVALFFLALADNAHGLERKRKGGEDCVVQEDGSAVCADAETRGTDYYDDDDDDDDDTFSDDGNDDRGLVEDTNCKDTHESCSFWASGGECNKNANYMLKACKRSCNVCPDRMLLKSKAKEMKMMEKEQLLQAVAEYGKPQTVQGKDEAQTLLVVRKTIDYMRNYIFAETPTHRLSTEIISQCTNNHELCAFWVALGECEQNISYMTTKCAPSCQTCANIDFGTRCPKRADDAEPGLRPGELNLMFERIVETAPGNQTEASQVAAKEKKVQDDGTPFYTVTVHSRPESPAAIADESGVIPVDMKQDRREDPFVVTFDNFLTDEECDHLIQLGYSTGYDRSKDVGTVTTDGTYTAVESKTRTSENAWCSEKTGCRDDPISKRVMERIANVTKIPSENFEDFQMLKYEEGQFYRVHHDYIGHQRDRACGPRILTFFLYLSDVEEGGGTGLTQVNGGLVVNPKKGKALLWPSVYNFDPR